MKGDGWESAGSVGPAAGYVLGWGRAPALHFPPPYLWIPAFAGVAHREAGSWRDRVDVVGEIAVDVFPARH